MNKSLRLLILSALISSNPVNAQEDEEFSREAEYLNQRYEDFFIHENLQKKHQEQVQAGASEVKEIRQRDMEAHEAARREHIANRKPPADTSQAEAEWLAEQERLKAMHNQKRIQHIDRRERLNQIRDTARKIPENKDAGLE